MVSTRTRRAPSSSARLTRLRRAGRESRRASFVLSECPGGVARPCFSSRLPGSNRIARPRLDLRRPRPRTFTRPSAVADCSLGRVQNAADGPLNVVFDCPGQSASLGAWPGSLLRQPRQDRLDQLLDAGQVLCAVVPRGQHFALTAPHPSLAQHHEQRRLQVGRRVLHLSCPRSRSKPRCRPRGSQTVPPTPRRKSTPAAPASRCIPGLVANGRCPPGEVGERLLRHRAPAALAAPEAFVPRDQAPPRARRQKGPSCARCAAIPRSLHAALDQLHHHRACLRPVGVVRDLPARPPTG